MRKAPILLKLPDDSVRVICDYLRVEHPFAFVTKNIQTHLRAVLDTCKRMQELKLSVVGTWHFKREYAERYNTDEAFRARVYEALAIPATDGNPQNREQQQQLSIYMDLGGSSQITDVSALGNVHTLNLSWCEGITDVSALGNMYSLELSKCNGITDVSALGNVHTLDLRDCRSITDVSALGNVHRLYLSRCDGIKDVSALGGVHSLELSGCRYNITDVSALGNVHTLNLSHCHCIKDVSMLGNVHTLNLRDCRGVTDMSELINVSNLIQ